MDAPSLNLLTDPLIRIRDPDGQLQRFCLPELFVALGRDLVRDYPALRPHQRHPWHALLVQLAAIAMHQAGESQPWDNPADWRKALLALTPEHPDGSAFCMVTPLDKPAFLQAPVPEGTLDGWKDISTPDALDMLVTSKNHDLKGERMRTAEADDWLFALTSLQTQEGYPGAGNFGISRMNGGSSSRPGVGLVPTGRVGKRWRRDVAALLKARDSIAETYELCEKGGLALVWLQEWSGVRAERIRFGKLDPLYIEICRRIRFESSGMQLSARRTTSETTRIDADSCKGRTGDPWIPIEETKSLTLTGEGFHYRLIAELAWGAQYRRTITQEIQDEDGEVGLVLLAQCVVRGQSKTEGYHERRVPLSKKAVGLLRRGQTDLPALLASQRVEAVAKMRGSVLRPALFALLEAGTDKLDFDRRTAKQQVEPFVQAFERAEDARFFDDLNTELDFESEDERHAERLKWLIGLAERAEAILRSAFSIGPQCGERRYRARSRALSFFHGALRNEKNLPQLAQHLRSHTAAEETAS